MYNSKIIGLGHYVPANIVTNDDLSKIMDTTDEWIQERTGIKERRWVKPGDGQSTFTMGLEAAKMAISNAGIDKEDLDLIVFCHFESRLLFSWTWGSNSRSFRN